MEEVEGDKAVTPCVGVWIEIDITTAPCSIIPVTPCVGVWIEIITIGGRGDGIQGHSLRGSVD